MSHHNHINVALVGQGFMGRTHSNAWGQVSKFFQTPVRPVLHTVAGLPAENPAAKPAPAPEPAEMETPLDAKTKARITRFRERAIDGGVSFVRDCRYADGGLLLVYAVEDKWNALDCEKKEKAARALHGLWLETAGKKIEIRGKNDEVLAAENPKVATFAYPLGGPAVFTIKGCEETAPPKGGK